MKNITDENGISFIILKYETDDDRYGVFAIQRSQLEKLGLNICENGCRLEEVGSTCQAFLDGYNQYRLATEQSGHFVEEIK